MKYNVSKFLIKSALLIASVATFAPGFVSGMESQEMENYKTGEQCLICLKDIVKDNIPKEKLDKENQVKEQELYKLEKKEIKTNDDGSNSTICGHRFCKECIKRWIKEDQSCPICKREISQQEIKTIETLKVKRIKRNLKITPEQQNEVDFWNKDSLELYKCGSQCTSNPKQIYPRLIRNEHTSEFGYSPAFESEDDFVDTNLGMCYECGYIMERPETLQLSEVTKTKFREIRPKFGKYIKKCPCCNKENVNLEGVKQTQNYTYDYEPRINLKTVDLLFSLCRW